MSKPLWVGRSRWMLALALFAMPAAATSSSAAGEPLGERESYAFARTVEGSANVTPEGQGVGEALERNQPLLTGDRVRTDGRSQLELLLPDRSRLTLDGRTSVRLVSLAFSGDREARVTILELEEGEILLEVSEEALGDELPRIESSGATIYVQEPGLYRIRTGGDGWLELVTRAGFAELVTDRGSTIVRAGEAAEAGAGRRGRIEISQAGQFDDLEQWSVDVAQGADRNGSSARHLDESVDYAASDLDQNGDWVVVESVNYWRPRVSVGWRPYWDGRWSWTPSGYTWVSYEPWGWVPYHYGRWSILPGYGWAWRPGAVYSPAWVYWHWSGGYAGWCPTGYYTDYYNPWYRGGYRWGNYGWAGGDWGYYNHWNFAPVNCFRNRDFRGHMRRGPDLRRENRWPEVPRGLITTDTRDFRPDRIDNTDQLLHRIRDRELNSTRGELPDVTDFVGRKRDLPPPVARAVVPDGPREPRLRIDTPKVDETPAWRRERGTPDLRADGGKRDGVPTVADSKGTPRTSGEARGDVKGEVQTGVKNAPGKPGGSGVAADRTVRVGVGGPATAAPRSGAATGGSDPRQGWKDRTAGTSTGSSVRSADPTSNPTGGSKSDPQADTRPRSSAPVERVISGTRRNLPTVDDGGSYGSQPPPRTTGSGRTAGTSSPSGKPIEATPRSRPRTDGGGTGASGSSQVKPPKAESPGMPRSGGSYATPGSSGSRGSSAGAGYGGSTSGKPAVTRPAGESRSRPATSTPPTTRSSGSTGSSGRATAGSSSGSSGKSTPSTSGGSRGSTAGGSSRSGGSGGSTKSTSSSSGSSKSSDSSRSGSNKSSSSEKGD